MSEYDLDWVREVVKYVCGISFLIAATCITVVVFFDVFNSPIADTITGASLVSGVISGWVLVIIDFLFIVRGNEDD